MTVSRDTLVVAVALGLAAFEVIVGGARPAVLTFITALLASPLVARLDRQNSKAKNHANS